jgi:hypothetical protein
MPEQETTPVQATNEPTETPEPQEGNGTNLTLDEAVAALKAANNEAAKYRIKAREAREATEKAKQEAERAKLDDLERVQLEKADLEKQLEAERDKAQRALRKSELVGKAADADAALRLLDADKHINEDGSINQEAFFTDYPFMKAGPAGPAAHTPSNPSIGKGGGPQSIKDFDGKDQAYYDEHWDAFVRANERKN